MTPPQGINPAPVASINEWSCALACIEWVCRKWGKELTQDHLISNYGLWFPEWFHRKGLMGRGDIINLFLRLGFPIRNFAHFNEKEEVLRLINAHYANYAAGFVLTRKPCNHCLAIEGWTAEVVHVMNPARTNPFQETYNWTDLFQKYEADVLWLFW